MFQSDLSTIDPVTGRPYLRHVPGPSNLQTATATSAVRTRVLSDTFNGNTFITRCTVNGLLAPIHVVCFFSIFFPFLSFPVFLSFFFFVFVRYEAIVCLHVYNHAL